MAFIRSVVRDASTPAIAAGVTAFIWYAFGAVPLHLAVSGQLGLTAEQTSSWIFIVWFSGAVSSILLTLYYRQPIPITWTIPGLIYIGTLAGEFTYPEIVGASLVAGVLIVALSLLGVGSQVMRWLPMPIIMGMFAGSIVVYATRLVTATVEDVAVAGTTVAGFLVGRMIKNPRIPPVGLAILFGGVAVVLTQSYESVPVAWQLPTIAVPAIEFSLSATLAISLALVVLSMGIGNVQGLGFLVSQGYKVPIDRITLVTGLNSIVNALFGGHPAIVARTGVAIIASPEAGALERRYVGNLVAAALTMVIAIAAMPVSSLIAILPSSYIFTLAGLAILAAFQDALEKAFGALTLRLGAVVAFMTALTPFSILGITSAFWAVIAGLAVTLMVDRKDLFAYWSEAKANT